MQLPKVELTEEQQKVVAERIHRSACFQRAFSGTDGEFALKEIDALTCYKSNTFDPDPYQSAYNAGQRSVAVFIHNVIDQDIEEARKLLTKPKRKKGKK
jgi:hypothetical protein